MIKVGIIGATGYAGGELVRILTGHKDAEIVWYGSRSYVGEDFASIYRNTAHAVNEPCKDDDMAKLAEIADVIFTATPQGFCASQVTEDILSKTKIIDLSADFRIKDVEPRSLSVKPFTDCRRLTAKRSRARDSSRTRAVIRPAPS